MNIQERRDLAMIAPIIPVEEINRGLVEHREVSTEIEGCCKQKVNKVAKRVLLLTMGSLVLLINFYVTSGIIGTTILGSNNSGPLAEYVVRPAAGFPVVLGIMLLFSLCVYQVKRCNDMLNNSDGPDEEQQDDSDDPNI
jgi:hypothetical protein